MIGILLCGYNLSCHIGNVRDQFTQPKYPPDVAVICQYFEDQKAQLPDYCKWQTNANPVRRRSDF